MIHVQYTCDRCGKLIEGVMYTLTCYAEDVPPLPLGGCSLEVATQNTTQNLARTSADRHLCKACKDAITDGVFIV